MKNTSIFEIVVDFVIKMWYNINTREKDIFGKGEYIMGLDMYVFRARPPEDDPNVVYEYKEMMEKNYTIIAEGDINNSIVKVLKDYAVPYTLSVEKYDYKKMSAVYGLKGQIRLANCGTDGTTFTDGKKQVRFKDDELNDFIYKTNEVFWLLNLDEVGYWRKHYELQDAIHEMFLKDGVAVENCGYYKLDTAKIYAINDFEDGKQGLVHYIDDDLFYHEWY